MQFTDNFWVGVAAVTVILFVLGFRWLIVIGLGILYILSGSSNVRSDNVMGGEDEPVVSNIVDQCGQTDAINNHLNFVNDGDKYDSTHSIVPSDTRPDNLAA